MLNMTSYGYAAGELESWSMRLDFGPKCAGVSYIYAHPLIPWV